MRDSIGHVRVGEEGYPERLTAVRPSITEFWYRGDLTDGILDKTIAVVGSRRMSRYGKQVLSEVVPRLVAAGYTIVSGLMYGVDQEAHRVCLENGGRAVGVLGYGISYRSEEGAMKLADRVVENGGVVISEYEGDSVSQRWMFLARNRIVVGLSGTVLVVEGGEKSGTLDTVRRAVELGKTIYSVPGSVFSPTSAGTNALIANGVARALTSESLGELTGTSFGKEAGTLDGKGLRGQEAEVWARLRLDGPSSANELGRRLGKSMGEVLPTLSQMELRGLVTEERGVWRIS